MHFSCRGKNEKKTLSLDVINPCEGSIVAFGFDEKLYLRNMMDGKGNKR